MSADYKVLSRRGLFAGAGSLLAAPAIVRAQGQNGVALVIGNSKYQWEASLPNVKRDAPDIAKRFERLGLKTELLQDVSLAAMKHGVDKFSSVARSANLAALYFAGHGAQWEQETYIVPVDSDLSTPNTVKDLPSVSSIRASLMKARHRLLVFDSCRNNPADGWRQRWAMAQSISRVRSDSDGSSEPDTLLLFSTAPGRVALDGPPGQNSPFAAALLRQLANSSINLQELPANLRRDLLIATEGRQVLWDLNTYKRAFLLNGAPAVVAASKSGWSGDPSRIVELPKAYAFAKQHDLPMPQGLIAIRPQSASNDSRKIGAFQYPNTKKLPSILVVLSVEDPQSVELIMSSRYNGKPYWYFSRGTLSGDTLECTPRDYGGRYVFKWKDANSGSASIQVLDSDPSKSGKIHTGSLMRLDG